MNVCFVPKLDIHISHDLGKDLGFNTVDFLAFTGNPFDS